MAFARDCAKPLRVIDAKATLTVARFELLESVRSKWLVFLVLLFGAGATLGTYLFVQVLANIEQGARETLAQTTGVAPEDLPPDLVREEALPRLAGWIADEGIRRTLLEMEPYCVFFGFMALASVGFIALMAATQSVATDLGSGSARFALIRCGRLEWALGKLAGQLVLLWGALAVAALLSASVGGASEPLRMLRAIPWLLRAGASAWFYGAALVGIFFGVALAVRKAGSSRFVSLFLWSAISIVPDILDAMGGSWARLQWVFPAAHKTGLWSSELGTYTLSASALLLIGALGFGLGFAVFQRRDA